MDDGEDYDEFGNYIGPDLESEEEDAAADAGMMGAGVSEWDAEPDVAAAAAAAADAHAMEVDADASAPAVGTQIVLHEDKKYFPDADEIFPDAEVLVEEEDTQPLSQPIVAPVVNKRFEHFEQRVPETAYNMEFLCGLMNHSTLTRNVAIAGHLHHGKTTLVDMLVEETHEVPAAAKLGVKPLRYTDQRRDEQKRGVSIKATPLSLVLPDLGGKSHLVNLIDTPGHVNFSDEMVAGVRLADGVVVAVDVLEGVMSHTEAVLRYAVEEEMPVVVVLTKMDRLIVELKIPPRDAYFKLKHTLDEVNRVLAKYHTQPDAPAPRVSPVKGNVVFSAPRDGWSFTLRSFAAMYMATLGEDADSALSEDDLVKRLWGDAWFHTDSRKFRKKAPRGGGARTFVAFILEPLYKIYSQVISVEPQELEHTLAKLGVRLSRAELQLDTKPLLKCVCKAFFGHAGGLVSALLAHVPTPAAGAAAKVRHTYTGPQTSPIAEAMCAADAKGPLMVQVAKLYTKPDCSGFDALARVLSGTLSVGQRVHVLGENYSIDDPEDMTVQTVSHLWVYETRYRVEINRATPGNWVLIGGVDESIAKTATLTTHDDAFIFRPLRHNNASVVKLAIEPLNPSELPKMVEGLRKVSKSYPLAVTKVEESGEHTILGTGELYIDCLMHDLRELYSEIEIKVSDPVVSFCETVLETSALKCFAETPNKKNKLTMIAEPLEKGLGEAIENEDVVLTWDKKRLSNYFQQKYEWDLLASRSVWAFGGPNVLLNDTLPGEVDRTKLRAVKDAVVQGFQWGAREGPLCDEPIRNVKFKVLDASIADEPIARGGGQIIPTARRVCYSSFLTATPRLMEPVYRVEITAPADAIDPIYTVLGRRRGNVLHEEPKPGTPLFVVTAQIPVLDSFGFETDLRAYTHGQAFCLSRFDHWAVVPGDPLDKSIQLRPLEPAPEGALGRELMVKTRRRKGLAEDVSVGRYFDEGVLMQLAEGEADLGAFLGQ